MQLLAGQLSCCAADNLGLEAKRQQRLVYDDSKITPCNCMQGMTTLC